MKRSGNGHQRNNEEYPGPAPKKYKTITNGDVKKPDLESWDADECSWRVEDELQYEFAVSHQISRNLCQLLDEGNSIPFIARYRREQTGGMEPETLRQYKESYEGYKAVKEKCKKLISSVEKLGKLTVAVRRSFVAARTNEELDITFAPFKTSAKTSLAERARSLGLGEVAENILRGKICSVNLQSLIDPKTPGKTDANEIEKGIHHVIAECIMYNKDFATFLRDLQNDAYLVMEVKETKAKEKTVKEKTTKEVKKAASGKNETDPRKFEIYFNFKKPVRLVQPYQVLAINRGENLKFLTVKINVPDSVLHQVEKQVRYQWLQKGMFSQFRSDLVMAAVADAYKRLICPQIIRHCRADLTKTAENEAIDSFAKNLKKLLLTAPYHGKNILSIDPGFSHGCKIGVISTNGDVLGTDIIYPRFNSNANQDQRSFTKLQDLVLRFNIETIAIGNGTACRETEQLVDYAIRSGMFRPMRVQYVIVEERGASVYSCTDVAKKEFPKMDTNLISAISLGRRLQDPLSEYVKIEPHHLGCGMYQHDVKQTKLKAALDETVIECVSFVGVNVNTSSEHLLQRVAGLTATRAKAIIEFRRKNGDFESREDLKKVKGIGAKAYEQCAGFIRVMKCEVDGEKQSKKVKYNPLDATNIHPESYAAASNLLKLANLNISNIGSGNFKDGLILFMKTQKPDVLADKLKIGVPTLNLIVESLEKGLGYDMRESQDGPIFKSGMTRLEDVEIGTVLTGRVTNVTAFGAFVDIGLGKDGLLHNSKMRRCTVELGNRVQVKLILKEPDRGKIGLELVQIM